jgi:hypothetical protein
MSNPLRTQAIPPNTWTYIPDVDLEVHHLGPGGVDVLITPYGSLMLSGLGFWEVRRPPTITIPPESPPDMIT